MRKLLIVGAAVAAMCGCSQRSTLTDGKFVVGVETFLCYMAFILFHVVPLSYNFSSMNSLTSFIAAAASGPSALHFSSVP